MFAFELSTVTLCGAAPYYSLVIRDPYIIGNHPAADIAIAYDGISEQHVSLTVLHAQEAEREQAAAIEGGVATAPKDDGNVDGQRHATAEEEEEKKEEAAEEEEEKEAAADAAVPKLDADAGAGEAGEAADEEQEEKGEEVRAPPATSHNNDNNNNNNRLVVRVTALPSKGDGEVRIGNVFLQPGDSVIARDGDVLFLGDGVRGTFHYRPLMVGLEVGTYPDDYVSDLRRMFDQLGATFVDEPIPTSEVAFVPVGQLYCAEELNDSTSCLAALAYGYSVVQPTYVFEWFAAVSRKASAPLSTLPSPARFEVPVRCTTHPTTTTYLRPESDTCPFSLFPIPSTAIVNRSRADLFAGRVFFFFTDAAATRYWRAVEDCGGAVYGPGDVEAAKEAIHCLVEAQRGAGVTGPRLPNNFYIVIDNTSEAVLLNSGLETASPELLAFMDEVAKAYGAMKLCVMGDHSLFTALLSNQFYEEPVELTAAAAVTTTAARYDDAADGFSVPPLSTAAAAINGTAAAAAGGSAAPASARTPRTTYSPRHQSVGGPATVRSASRMSTRESDRRLSLLPRTENRTPSRSQLRSYSRQQARSASMRSARNDGVSASGYEAGSYYGGGGSTSPRRGRRHLVPSVIEGEMRSFVEDFDMVRVRIYAFLVREEPRLDLAIATYHRNFYMSTDAMEYALEIKAQAEDFMEHVDDLLADPACHGAYTDSLRRFWRDCSDMDVKAQHLLHSWDRRFPATALPRRSVSAQRASSAGGRRAFSSRSVTPRGNAASTASAAAVANSPASAHHPRGGNYLASATAPQARDPEGSQEHRDLHMSPEAAQRLQEVDQILEDAAAAPQDHSFTHHDVSAGSGAAAPSSRPRGYSTSSRQSRRRSLTSHSKGSRRQSTSHTVPMDQNPPWVENWAEEAAKEQEEKEQQEKQQQEEKERQQQEAEEVPVYRSFLHETPMHRAKKSKTPRAGPKSAPAGEVAEYAPNVVRTRSNGRNASRPRPTPAAKADAPQQPQKQSQQHLHETAPSDGSVKFSIEDEDETTSPLEFVEESASQPPLHTEEETDTHDATEGTVDFVEEEPATHAAEVAHTVDTAHTTEEEADESQMRTAPAPTPQPAPASKPRKAATPSSRKPRSKLTATKAKRAAEHNGNATNGHASGASSRNSKPQSAKPRVYAAWKF